MRKLIVLALSFAGLALVSFAANATVWTITGGSLVSWFTQGINGSGTQTIYEAGFGSNADWTPSTPTRFNGYNCFGIGGLADLSCGNDAGEGAVPEVWGTSIVYSGTIDDDFVSGGTINWTGESGTAASTGSELFTNSILSGSYDINTGVPTGTFGCWNNPTAVNTYGADFCGNGSGGATPTTFAGQTIANRALPNGMIGFTDNMNGTIQVTLSDTTYSDCLTAGPINCLPDANSANTYATWTLNATPTGPMGPHIIDITNNPANPVPSESSVVDGGCVAPIPATGGFDCEYDASDPFGAGTQWSGPVLAGGYYAVGTSPYQTGSIGDRGSVGDGKINVPLFTGSEITIDDGSDPDPAMAGAPTCSITDRIGGTLVLSAATHAIDAGQGSNAEETWDDGGMSIFITPTTVTSATVTPGGGCDYEIASGGFPPLLDVTSGGTYPQDVIVAPGTYAAPSPIGIFCGTDGGGFLGTGGTGAEGNCGVVNFTPSPGGAAIFAVPRDGNDPASWSCDDNSNPLGPPKICFEARAGGCDFDGPNFCGDHSAFENGLIRLTRDSAGAITDGVIIVQDESRIFNVGAPDPDFNSWVNTVYHFSGPCTNCGLVRDDTFNLLPSQLAVPFELDVGANDSPALQTPATLTVDSQPSPGSSTVVPGVNNTAPQSLTVTFTWDTTTFGTQTFQYSIDDGVAIPADGLVGTVRVNVAQDSPPVAKLFAVTGAGNAPSTLFELDPDTGAVVRMVGATGFSYITAMDFHPLTGDLYAIAQNASFPATGTLMTLDIDTGIGTMVAQTTAFSDMGFHPDGRLFGALKRRNTGLTIGFYEIDIVTGAFTLVASIGHHARPGITFNSVGNGVVKNSNSVYSFNPDVPSTSFLRSISGSSLLNTLEYNENDMLFGVTSSNLVTIDINAGTQTIVGPVSNRYTALASQPVPCFVIDAMDDQFTVINDGTPADVNVLSNDECRSDRPISIIALPGDLLPDQGGEAMTDGSTVTYTPPAGFIGPEIFTYTAQDAGLDGGDDPPAVDQDTATVTVTLLEDLIPEAVDDEAEAIRSATVVIDVLENDTLGNPPNTFSIIRNPDNGFVFSQTNTTISYFSNSNFLGIDTFDYELTDANGDSDIATVSVGAFFHGGVMPIDVKPHDGGNNVNLISGRSTVEVAILSVGEFFDAPNTIDPLSLKFATREANIIGDPKFRDIDRDGDIDLLIKFVIGQSGISCGASTVLITGRTFTGQFVIGADTINTTHCPRL